MGFGGGTTDVEPLMEQRDMPAATTKQLILTTICFAGVQFGWALQISLLTPFILELGLPAVWVTLVWLCGPISGFIVQPTVGVLSDFATFKMGRRRPFIIIGGIFVVVALLMIPNAPDLGRLFGDTKHHNPGAIVMAVLGFWLLDLANNTLQGPCRALVADIARPEQQERGNAIFSVWLAVGNVLGYLAGWASWSTWMPWWQSESCDVACANLRCAFTIAIFFLASTVTITCVYTKEIPRPKDPTRQKPAVFSKIFGLIRRMPTALARICLVQFFSWFAWFAFFIYITTWVGQVVENGDPQADHDSRAYKRYTEGVQMGSFGLAFYAGVSAATSPLVAWAAEKFGSKWTWASGQVSMAVLLFCTLFVKSTTGAVVIIALIGFPWSVTMTVPFALTAQISPRQDRGLYMGALNIFVVLPQCVMAMIGPLLVSTMGEHHAIRTALQIGAAASVVACFFIPGLITKVNTSNITTEVVEAGTLADDLPSGHEPSAAAEAVGAEEVDERTSLIGSDRA